MARVEPIVEKKRTEILWYCELDQHRYYIKYEFTWVCLKMGFKMM